MLNLQIFRKKKGFTQSHLVREIGVTQKTYSKWETGKSKPTIDKIPQILKVLEIPITSLFR
ncbi:helix-turn-helix domain-containing protein [Globicatella sp. HMSC072A10]|uniref:helix-turn-helix domain-containing protein n=1 Tax=Globicatella sp. HMSC072A10 TaxID=1739315 RepID=UPI0008AE2E8D|nr:helix-turn-helix transcriptional regulator [Globicatella sp. HMSC072A10]OFK60923.1 hypothetical protein HMPREF2811_03415 [Globicatella sp. HMSC072A10]